MPENAARAWREHERDRDRGNPRPELRLIEAEAHPRRADRYAAAPMAEVRTIRIDSSRPAPRRRPDPVKAAVGARPDRVAMWAVLLGVFLTVVAAATGHA
jgi:hypothetical protein